MRIVEEIGFANFRTRPHLDFVAGTAGDTEQAQYWTGLRPATPSNVPIIGRSRLPKFFLNTGHGTLGWTHGAGSGKAMAELISGESPAMAFGFYGYEHGRRQPGLSAA